METEEKRSARRSPRRHRLMAVLGVSVAKQKALLDVIDVKVQGYDRMNEKMLLSETARSGRSSTTLRTVATTTTRHVAVDGRVNGRKGAGVVPREILDLGCERQSGMQRSTRLLVACQPP